jgi:hypothetical protein
LITILVDAPIPRRALVADKQSLGDALDRLFSGYAALWVPVVLFVCSHFRYLLALSLLAAKTTLF